jgi:hypothetical protein
MSVRRVAASFAFVLSFAALAACAVEEAPPGRQPRLRDGVSEGTQGPGTKPSDDEPASSDGTTAPVTPTDPTTPTTPETEQTAAKKVLDVTWFGQETYYWCAPGSARMALGTRMENPPSQTDLANFMGTTTNGTDHIGLVAKALNKYIEGAGYKTREISDPPTAEQRELLKTDILARVGKGFPMVANVVSGWRPAGYPGGTIYHYVAVLGYDESGAKVLIADPAAEGKGGGASWNSVPRTYWITLDDLGTWIGGKGYTG